MNEIDENEGLGGSYIIDPKTGKRNLVERTVEKPVVPITQTDYNGEKSGQTSGDE